MHVFSITFIFQFHLKCMNFLFKNIGEKIYNIAIPCGNIQFRPFFSFSFLFFFFWVYWTKSRKTTTQQTWHNQQTAQYHNRKWKISTMRSDKHMQLPDISTHKHLISNSWGISDITIQSSEYSNCLRPQITNLNVLYMLLQTHILFLYTSFSSTWIL